MQWASSGWAAIALGASENNGMSHADAIVMFVNASSKTAHALDCWLENVGISPFLDTNLSNGTNDILACNGGIAQDGHKRHGVVWYAFVF